MVINCRVTVAELLPPKCNLINGKSLSESDNRHFVNEKPVFHSVKDCSASAATVLFTPAMKLKYWRD